MFKIQYEERLQVVNQIAENILKKGIIKDPEQAVEIARRWITYS